MSQDYCPVASPLTHESAKLAIYIPSYIAWQDYCPVMSALTRKSAKLVCFDFLCPVSCVAQVLQESGPY